MHAKQSTNANKIHTYHLLSLLVPLGGLMHVPLGENLLHFSPIVLPWLELIPHVLLL